MDTSTFLAYIGIILAVLVPVLAFGWKMLQLLSRVDTSNTSISQALLKVVENLSENDVSYAELIARLKVFEVKMDSEIKAIHLRLDSIDEKIEK